MLPADKGMGSAGASAGAGRCIRLSGSLNSMIIALTFGLLYPAATASPGTTCIVGAGIGGLAVADFLRNATRGCELVGCLLLRIKMIRL